MRDKRTTLVHLVRLKLTPKKLGCCFGLVFFYLQWNTVYSLTPAQFFIRGDCDVNHTLSVADTLAILKHLFVDASQPLDCLDACDSNDNGIVELGDAIFLLFHLFNGDPPPPPPSLVCGSDPTEDQLSCESFWVCGTGNFLNSLGLKMLLVAAGEFKMGSPITERGRYPDEHLHDVVITCPFYMGETEVTQEQFLKIMGLNPSYANGLNGGINYGTLLTRPVDNVTWFDAVEFCRRLSVKEGRKYRLPYEAEWEYACRAGTRTRFWFGDLLDCRDECCLECPSADAFIQYTFAQMERPPVRQKKPNPWGFYGIHGSTVSEWCSDWYGLYPKGMVVNPTGPQKGTTRVVRGHVEGPFGFRGMRSASRVASAADPASSDPTHGFRIVLELPGCRYSPYE